MRVIILGMNNPLSEDPRHALAPYPAGSAGHRLWRLLADRRPGLLRMDYMARFDRRNLVPGKKWIARGAALLGAALARELADKGRVVLVLGEEPRVALGLEKQLIHPFVGLGGTVWRQLPHPSGRCLWYNDPANRLLAGMLLEELYDRSEADA